MSRFFHYDKESSGVVEGHAPVTKKLAEWPMDPCCASGVNPNQAGELRNFYKKHGFRCDVTNNGDPVYESAGHRKAALKLRNLHDKDSFC